MRNLHWVSLIAFLSVAAPGRADLITLQYEVTAQTVVGNPLGLGVVRLMTATGSLTYNTATPDSRPADPNRGWYQHTSGGAFTMLINGGTVTGSTTPYAQVENDISVSDTFRYTDGASSLGVSGPMSVNGTTNTSAGLFIAITGGLSFLQSDALPLVFPPWQAPFPPHTFSLTDSGGTVLFQIDSLEQVSSPSAVPEPSSLALCLAAAAGGTCWIRRRRAVGECSVKLS